MKQSRNWLIVGLLAFGVAMRVLPYVLERYGLISLTDPATYAWNVSPVPAMCLLGGAYFASPLLGFVAGFAAYLLGDVLIGFVSGNPAFSFYATLPFVYAGFILIGVIGLTLRSKKTPGRIAVVALLGEAAFFLLTNFGEWAIGDNKYPETFAGLIECYVAALPFWKSSLIGMFIYAPVLFGLAAFVEHQIATQNLENSELELVRVRR